MLLIVSGGVNAVELKKNALLFLKGNLARLKKDVTIIKDRVHSGDLTPPLIAS